MFEGTYAPPFYNDLYNFLDGAQSDIFQDSYLSIPTPGPNQTVLPVLATPGAPTTSDGSSTTSALPTSTVPVNVTSSPSATPSSVTNSQWFVSFRALSQRP